MAVQDNPQPPTWNFAARPWDTPAPGAGKGATGDPGDKGGDGASSWDSGQTKNVCSTQPTDGKQGGDGKTPAPPPKAQKGRPSGTVRQDLGVCKGNITIWYGAGDGQQGGAGGPGGDGGTGGAKGNDADGCGTANQGPQGRGGKGGDGGEGGDGGDTQPITILYTDAGATFNVVQVGCGGGGGGGGGQPGGGTGNLGSGETGPGGKPSTAPAITFIKK